MLRDITEKIPEGTRHGEIVHFSVLHFKGKRENREETEGHEMNCANKKKNPSTSFAVKYFKKHHHHPAVSWPHIPFHPKPKTVQIPPNSSLPPVHLAEI